LTKRDDAKRTAYSLVEIDGLSHAQATRVLWESGFYEGARDYPTPGWLKGLLRDYRKDKAAKTAALLRDKVTRGLPPKEGSEPRAPKGHTVSHESGDESSEGRVEIPGKPGQRLRFEERDGGAVAESTSPRITTLDQLLKACAVDLRIWQIDRHVINKWEVGVRADDGGVAVEPLFQVKAWLSPRQAAPVELALEGLIARLRETAPPLPAPRACLDCGEYLLVPNLYDAHFNKRSADGAYTLERAATEFKAVADAVAARVQALAMPVARVLVPVGNDALHADDMSGRTTDGTWLETVADQRDAVDALVDACGYAIRRFAEIAPVDVVAVESNHDRFSSYWLGKVMEALFSRAHGITVDAARAPNKYYTYGQTLIGLQHGDKIKPDALAVLMAVEASDAWAQTRYRQWLRGHVHFAAGMFYPVTETHGVTVRVIPALCPPDQYHVLRGYVGGHRAAEVLYYHREYGPAGTFPVFVDEVVTEGVGT
jgi:hypothetical protein